jgi:hypothetical protein
MVSKQEQGGHGIAAPRRSLGWLLGAAIGAAALLVLVLGSVQVARPAAATAREEPAISAVVVSPIDHSVVQSIDPNAEPDSTGASIATYGP